MTTRLARNYTTLRLENKPSKRDLDWSNNELISSLDKYRLQSEPGEITHPNYVRIVNDHLDEAEVVDIICQTFSLGGE